jgi:phosphohistidine phosphatase
MDLLLWRHAEAEDGAPDLERRLTTQGEKQARRVAAWLAGRLPKDVLILVSPARRARQTADTLERAYRLDDSIAPNASPQAVLDAADWPHNKQSVLVVGHQPTLGEVAGLLLTAGVYPLSVKKGAVWWLAGKSQGGVALKAMISPDLV